MTYQIVDVFRIGHGGGVRPRGNDELGVAMPVDKPHEVLAVVLLFAQEIDHGLDLALRQSFLAVVDVGARESTRSCTWSESIVGWGGGGGWGEQVIYSFIYFTY